MKNLICYLVTAIALTWGNTSYGQGISSDANTLGLWRLDEASGTTITDASGRGHHGTTGGNPTIVSGRYNNARSFIADSIVVPDHADWSFGSNPFTIECWVNFSSNASHGIIVGQIGSGSDYWRLHYEISANKLEFVYPGSTTQYVWTPVTDQWYHLAVTKSDSVKIYINGIKVASGSIGSPGTVPNLSRPLIFGWGESNYYFKGSIDEIRISNIARSPAEFNLAPAAPANMTATAVSTSQINLSWTASTGGPTKYRIYRSDGIDNNYVQRDSISSPSANSYSATGLGTATTYYFKVASVNEFGEARSAAVCDTTESAGISFTENSVGSTLFSLGSPLDLGDYDNDGDLDILVAGNNGSTIATKLYSNQNGSFTDEFSSLDNMYAGGVQFGDYNRDGFLDFAILGSISHYPDPHTGGDPRLKLYKGNGTSSFSADTSLTPIMLGNIVSSVSWGDYDFDGKSDLLASGLLYKNQGGTGRTFSRVGFLPDSAQQGISSWCDYDGDGDLDFAYMAGVYGPEFYTQLWRNDGGSFTHITALDAVFPQVGEGTLAWGDYNCDGKPDLAICGANSGGRTTVIFKNNGNDQFVDIGASLIPLYNSLAWADFDNDGYLDLVLFGSDSGPTYAFSVYRNNRDNTFTSLGRAGINTISLGNVRAGDYDRDGKLDLVMTGNASNNANQLVILCHNTSAVGTNTKPSAPVVRNTIPGGDSVRFSWDQVTGDETPSNGLTYNVRVGTSSGASNIVNPMANTNTGLRRVSRQGNAWHDTAVVVRHLANGTYYWSVQAIDNSFEGGLFSSEKSFSIGVAPNAPSSLTAQIVNGSQVSLSWSAGAGTVKRYRIFRGTSPNPVTQVDSVTATSKTNTVSAAGIYYYRIAAVNDNGQSSFSNEVSLLVNSAPVWSDVSGKIPVTTAEDSTVNISLDPWAADPDHVDNALRFVVLNSSNGTVVLDTNTHTLSFAPSNNFSGIGTASVRVYDPLGGGDTTMFEFTISPRNDPVVKTATLRDTTLAEDFGAKKFIAKLSYFFSDVDNATLTFIPSVLNSAKTTATVSSDTLYATSVKDSNGFVDIRVVASDGLLSASDTLRLTISAVNDAPIRIALLQDQTINEDIGSSFRLSASFSDVETSSALLTYTASAFSFSDRLSGLRAGHDTLYFTPAHDSTGFVDIRISVSDGQYSVYDTVRINITPVNDPPKLVIPLTDIVRNEDFFLSAIVLSGNFADNETLSKNLKYQAEALNFASHLSLIQTGHDTLYIVGAADSNGFVDIEVTVKDDSLASAPPDTFRLTITAINDDPVRILSISDTTLAKDFGKKFMAYLPPNFRDIDNASLTYTTNATHVTPFISNDSLYLLSIAGDTASGISVIVTAKDAGNLTAKDTFTVNVRPISLGNFDSSSPSVSQATANSSVAIQFQTSSPIVSAKLFFKKGGEASFDSSSMNISGGVVSGIIPNTVIGSRGTSYYLRLSDGVNIVYSPAGAQTQANVHNIEVTLPSAQADDFQPTGKTAKYYRLISIPFELKDNNPISLFANFGSFDSLSGGWSLFGWNGTDYVRADLNGFPSIKPGRGYMFITSMTEKIRTDSVKTTPVNSSFPITVTSERWTCIGNPYDFNVAWDSVGDRDHVNTPIWYDGTENDWKVANVLEPWKGYFVFTTERTRDIKIPAKESGLAKRIEQNTVKKYQSGEWQIQIKTCGEGLNDQYNFVGMLSRASDHYDLEDRVESPRHPGNEFIKLYFDHSDWPEHAFRYGSDFRPIRSDGDVWDFDVNALISAGKIPLNFEQLENVPPDFEIILLDKDLKITRDLRKEPSYVFPAHRNAQFTRHFRIVIGKKDFVSRNLNGVSVTPEKFDLSQNYPNPFNPTTGIKFSLASYSRVRLTIYNILGQEVKTLVNENLQAGYQTVLWDGRNAAGQAVSSGVYLYRLQAEALDNKQRYTKTRKMLLVK